MRNYLRPAVLALVAFMAISAIAADKQPITHELLWMTRRVGAPSVSPDGKWVVFSVTDPSYDEKEQTTDLWIVPSDGSAKPRKLTASKAGESDATWSDDSRRIAFSAKRDGDEQNQIYVLDLAGGEAQRVTNISTGARAPKFRPDGNAIAFTSVVFPGAADDEANKKLAKEEKDRKFKVRAYESFPIRAWDRWMENKQPHIIVQSLDPGSKPKDVLAGTQLVAAAGFAGTGGGGEGGETIRGEWTPDGQWLIFAATTGRNTSAYAEFPYDLYRVSANGGEPEKITTANGGYGSPTFSPDGKTLYATFSPNNGKTYNSNRLVAFDWPSMKNERTVANTDRSVGDFVVSNDGKTLYFTAEDAGLIKLYSVPSKGGAAAVAIDQERGGY